MSIDDDIAVLRRIPSLGILGDAALRILAISAEIRTVEEGEVLFDAGDAADAGYVIQQGSFGLKRESSGDAEEITVGPGTLLGELALLTETRRPATATALVPSTLMRIPRTLFHRILDGYPDAARKLREYVATRSERMTRDMANVSTALDSDNARARSGSAGRGLRSGDT